MKKLISLSLAALCLIGCAAGCGKKDDESESKKKENQFIGKWECSEISFGGTTMTDFMGIPVAAMAQIEIKDGGKMTLTFQLEGDDETTEGTWKEIDEDTIEATPVEGENETIMLDYKDGKLIAASPEEDAEDSLGFGDMSLTFIKVDKFTEFSEEDLKGNLDFGDLDFDDEDLDPEDGWVKWDDLEDAE